MKRQKGLAAIEILIVLVVLIITLAGGVVVWQKNKLPTPTISPTPTVEVRTSPSPIQQGKSSILPTFKPINNVTCPPATRPVYTYEGNIDHCIDAKLDCPQGHCLVPADITFSQKDNGKTVRLKLNQVIYIEDRLLTDFSYDKNILSLGQIMPYNVHFKTIGEGTTPLVGRNSDGVQVLLITIIVE